MTPAAAEIIRLYQEEELSIAAVAEKTGAGRGRVHAVLKRAGIPMRRQGRPGGLPPEQAAAAADACRTGSATRLQAAQAAGTSSSTVYRALRRAGAVLVPDEDWLAPGEAVALAGLRRDHLSRLARAGAIESRRGTARGWHLYSRADVEALAAKRGQPGHRAVPEPGTEWSFLGQPAELDNEFHYPVEARCGCGEQVILVTPGGTWVRACEYYGTGS